MASINHQSNFPSARKASVAFSAVFGSRYGPFPPSEPLHSPFTPNQGTCWLRTRPLNL